MSVNEAIQSNIKRLREKSGMTQDELAEQMQISRQLVSMYERGARPVSAQTAFQFADVFGVSILELAGKEKQ